jgi:hypothetical protein
MVHAADRGEVELDVERIREGIADVVVHLGRSTRAARAVLARHDLTIAYLEAGRRLLYRQFGSVDSDEDEHRPFFDWLTRDKLFDEVRAGAGALPRQPSDGSYRDRWRCKSDFTADLVAYVLWSPQWQRHVDLAVESVSVVDAPPASFWDAVEEVAFRDLQFAVEPRYIDTFRAQMVMQAMLEHDPAAARGINVFYQRIHTAWTESYAAVMAELGLRFRSDVTVDDFAVLLTAVAEGLAFRRLADPDAKIMDPASRTSLLGLATRALAAICFDPGDGLTTRQNCDDVLASLTGSFRPRSPH